MMAPQKRFMRHFNFIGYRRFSDPVTVNHSIDFKWPCLLQEGYLWEGDGRKYFVLKGSHLFVFPQKVQQRQWSTATEAFDLSVYDNVEQISYNLGKFSLESSTEGDKRIFMSEKRKEMLQWLRNIRCVHQNIHNQNVPFIDPSNKRSPYLNL